MSTTTQFTPAEALGHLVHDANRQVSRHEDNITHYLRDIARTATEVLEQHEAGKPVTTDFLTQTVAKYAASLAAYVAAREALGGVNWLAEQIGNAEAPNPCLAE